MKAFWIRKIYLYLFSVVGLVLAIIGAVRLISLGLRAYIFTEADKYYEYPMPRPVMPSEKTPAVTPEAIVDPKELEEYQNKQQRSNRQREAAGAVAQLIVGIPLYLYHWSLIRKEKDIES